MWRQNEQRNALGRKLKIIIDEYEEGSNSGKAICYEPSTLLDRYNGTKSLDDEVRMEGEESRTSFPTVPVLTTIRAIRRISQELMTEEALDSRTTRTTYLPAEGREDLPEVGKWESRRGPCLLMGLRGNAQSCRKWGGGEGGGGRVIRIKWVKSPKCCCVVVFR